MQNNINVEVKKKALEVFAKILEIAPDSVTPMMEYNSHPKWDSFKHLELISSLEQAFGIDLRMEDVIEMHTFKQVEETVLRYVEAKNNE